jgi:hyaluronan synthase
MGGVERPALTASGTSASTTTVVRQQPAAAVTGLRPSVALVPARKRRLNPLAAVPYLIGATILALEAMLLV